MESIKKYSDKVIGNIIGKNFKGKKVEIEKEGKELEVEWEND